MEWEGHASPWKASFWPPLGSRGGGGAERRPEGLKKAGQGAELPISHLPPYLPPSCLLRCSPTPVSVSEAPPSLPLSLPLGRLSLKSLPSSLRESLPQLPSSLRVLVSPALRLLISIRILPSRPRFAAGSLPPRPLCLQKAVPPSPARRVSSGAWASSSISPRPALLICWDFGAGFAEPGSRAWATSWGWGSRDAGEGTPLLRLPVRLACQSPAGPGAGSRRMGPTWAPQGAPLSLPGREG